jgi:hypothetical protein
MKKIIITSLVVLTMLILTINTGSSTPANTANKVTPVMAGIRYEVILSVSRDWGTSRCPINIWVSDENNRPVALPQAFKPGVFTYNFYEIGPVTGTRVAHVKTNTQIHGPGICPFVNDTQAQYNTFLNGSTYPFYFN